MQRLLRGLLQHCWASVLRPQLQPVVLAADGQLAWMLVQTLAAQKQTSCLQEHTG
jgi:hypothetical protein